MAPLLLAREGAGVRAFAGAIRSDAVLPAPETYMGDEALALLSRLTVEARRRELVCGQWLARAVAAAYLESDALRIARGAFGQLIVQAPVWDVPALSLSHAGEWVVALAFPTGHPMGIDLERVDAAHAATLAAVLSADERALAGAGERAVARTTQAWALKEAVSKATLCGLVVKMEALALAETTLTDDTMDTRYATFRQYRGRAWVGEKLAVAIACPFKTELPRAFPFPDVL